jgi:hypothetical protein
MMSKPIIKAQIGIVCKWCKQEICEDCDECGDGIINSVNSIIYCHDEDKHYCEDCGSNMDTVEY